MKIGGVCALLGLVVLVVGVSQWETLPISGSRINSLSGFGGALFLGPRKLYVFGGRGDSGVSGDVWWFDFLSKSWNRMPASASSPPARFRHTMVKMSDDNINTAVPEERAIVFGGVGADGLLLKDAWALNISSATWKELKPPPTSPIKPPARARHCSVTYNGVMYVFGGFSDSGNMNDLWAFDFGNSNAAKRNVWTNIAFDASKDSPTPRSGHTCVRFGLASNSRMIVFGGAGSDNQPLNDLWALHIKADTTAMYWERIDVSSTPPPPRQGHAGTLLGPKLVIHGGQGDDGLGQRKALRDVWMLDIDNRRWKSVSATGDVLVAFQHQFFAVQDTIVAFGGLGESGQVLGDVYELKVFEAVWTKIVPSGILPIARFGHFTAITPDLLILYGGADFRKTVAGDLWTFDFSTRQWKDMTAVITSSSSTSAAVWEPLMAPTGGRCLGSSFQVDGYLYTFGGYNANGAAVNDLSALHIGSMTWRTVKPATAGTAPAARAKPAAVLVDDAVVVAGGVGTAGVFADVWLLSILPIPGSEITNNHFEFDGINDLVATPLMTTPQAFTLEFWVQVREFNAPYQPFVAQGVGISSGFAVTRTSKLNTVMLVAAGSQLRGSTSVNDGRWHHVAVVFDPVVQRRQLLYIDGKEDTGGGKEVTSSLGQSTVPLIIGTDAGSTRIYFSGKMDEVRFWSTGRTATQIKASMFTRLQGNEPQLIGLWNFDVNNFDNGITSDMSPSGAHGRIGDGTAIASPLAAPSTVPTSATPVADTLPVQGSWVKLFEATPAQLEAGTAPVGRVGAAITALGSNVVILFGGNTADSGKVAATATGTTLNDVWKFEILSRRWTLLVPLRAANTQTLMYGHKAVLVDSYNARLIGKIDSLSRGPQFAITPFDTGAAIYGSPSFPKGLPPLTYHSVNRDAVRTVVFGGDFGSSLSQAMYTNLAGSGSWSRVDPVGSAPPGRFWPQLRQTADPNILLLFGGWGVDGPLEDMWEYRLDSGQFFAVEQLGDRPNNLTIESNNARAEHCFVVRVQADGTATAVLFGGETLSGLHNSLTFFDIATRVWRHVEPTNPPSQRPSPRAYFPGVIWRDQLWAFGGYAYANSNGDDLIYGDLWRYEFTSNTWFEVKTNPTASEYGIHRPQPRWGSGLFVYKDHLYVFGGETWATTNPLKTGRGGRLRDVWKLNYNDSSPSAFSTWSLLRTSSSGALPVGRRSASITVYRNWLIVFGGLSFNAPAGFGGDLNDLYALELDSDPHVWTELKYLGKGPIGKANAAFLTIENGDNDYGLLYAGITHIPSYDYQFDVAKLFFELAYPRNCRAIGDAKNVATAGTDMIFKIEAVNIFGVKKTVGGDFFEVELSLTSGPSAGARFRATVVDQYNGEHMVYYNAEKVGQYKLTVKTQGTNIGETGEAETLNVNPAKVVALQTTAEGEGISRSVAGVEGTFVVTSRDLHTNIGLGGDDVFVFLEGPIRNETDSVPGRLTASVTDHDNGQYTVKYLITVSGEYRTSVLLGNVPASGSPFTTLIEPGPVVAALSLVHGSGLEDSAAGSPSVVVVQTRDHYHNNRTTMGTDDVQITFQGPGDVGKRTVAKPLGIYEITYFPFNPGAYDFKISVQNLLLGEKSPVLWTSTCAEEQKKEMPDGQIACHFDVNVKSVFEPNEAVDLILSLTLGLPAACYGFGILIYVLFLFFRSRQLANRAKQVDATDVDNELQPGRMAALMDLLGKTPTSKPSEPATTTIPAIVKQTTEMQTASARAKLGELVATGQLTAEDQSVLEQLLAAGNPVVEGAFDVFSTNPSASAQGALVNRLRRIAHASVHS